MPYVPRGSDMDLVVDTYRLEAVAAPYRDVRSVAVALLCYFLPRRASAR
jgi:hypothetical protein